MDVGAAVRLLLGLGEGPAPTLEILPRPEGELFPPVLVDVGTADGRRLHVELRDRDAEPAPWLRAAAVGLGYRTDGHEPLDDPELGPRLRAIGRRFLRAQGALRPAELAAAIDALRRAGRATTYVGTDRLSDLQRHFDRDGQDIWCHPEGSRESAQATLRLGFRCNQACRFCWQGRHWPDAPIGRWRADLEQQVERGVRSLTITGGEPTLYRHLPRVIETARQLGLRVNVQTNAVRLRKPAYTQTLVDAGLTALFVSLHSSDPVVSDQLTGVAGTHAHTLTGIQIALEAGLQVALNTVVERATLAGLPEHAALVAERLSAVSGVVYSHPNNYFDRDAWRRALVPHDEVRDPLVQACRILLDAGVEVDVLGTCGFPSCLVADVPELLHPVRSEEFDQLDTTGRLYGAVCDECSLRPDCLGLRREYVEVYGERGIHAIRR